MNNNLFIREPQPSDQRQFLDTMQRSHGLHSPWVVAPLTTEDFQSYIQRSLHPNNKNLLALNKSEDIIGVFNLSEIVRGAFQNAYLGFYASIDFQGQGMMSAAMKLVLKHAFIELKLHRIEANIQPGNLKSINLVKKNGFREEGYSPRYLKINDVWCDHLRFAMTYEDWENASLGMI
ncbi:TPA: GNAT family N-acetyltransferase [Legionella pneumophila]|nr:GNAT family N-acetyltransferase [Legionella pneumophila]